MWLRRLALPKCQERVGCWRGRVAQACLSPCWPCPTPLPPSHPLPYQLTQSLPPGPRPLLGQAPLLLAAGPLHADPPLPRRRGNELALTQAPGEAAFGDT
ncbi:unnamed protein product [Arctogadus glacialis]